MIAKVFSNRNFNPQSKTCHSSVRSGTGKTVLLNAQVVHEWCINGIHGLNVAMLLAKYSLCTYWCVYILYIHVYTHYVCNDVVLELFHQLVLLR